MTDSPDIRTAVLFDIDGTLVDSNYLHIEAWHHAFAAVGHPVDAWRIHRSIGMDSGMLLDALLGDAAESVGDAAKQKHAEFYENLADRLRPIEGARALLSALADRGHGVVLATSAPESELETLLEVLDVGPDVDAVTSSEDVGTAKPDPDIIEVALKKACVPADRGILVGDAVWDVKAALRAGVQTIGVRSGGYSAAELRDAGAIAVYDDVADLLAHLDVSPIANLRD
ncbi:HAD family hydrolase [Microbacterium sp. cx-55]|uniref:HAD family hydrolase n=1 Tax=Microbacterium sp. cx-55 TaxID=2875948 RepID=UPI001CC01780|nr:HAD family hydrolase [Microbacterium sp. cx-55]MBZ4486851.1 HAD family hydrolase [Microbacterium sp. cx-55]UGB35778.1 HAD family hydrolase [Microbacterium sp. cx-55]